MAEIRFFSTSIASDATEIPILNVSNPEGFLPYPPGEEIDKLTDGKVTTKWLD